jgi:hypothetical protein
MPRIYWTSIVTSICIAFWGLYLYTGNYNLDVQTILMLFIANLFLILIVREKTY